jgi:hypothetical protein
VQRRRPAAAPRPVRRRRLADGTRWSDGTDGVERLLDFADLAVLDTGIDQPIETLVAIVDRTFADLEHCFTGTGTGTGDPAPATRRAQLATELGDTALQIIAGLRANRPDFADLWCAPGRRRRTSQTIADVQKRGRLQVEYRAALRSK